MYECIVPSVYIQCMIQLSNCMKPNQECILGGKRKGESKWRGGGSGGRKSYTLNVKEIKGGNGKLKRGIKIPLKLE